MEAASASQNLGVFYALQTEILKRVQDDMGWFRTILNSIKMR